MWLLVIEIIAAIIASVRGWGIWPLVLIGTTFILGLVFGPSATYGTITFLAIIDWIVTAVVIGMAIIGRKSSKTEPHTSLRPHQGTLGTTTSRIKCPYCAELIMPEARICRYCRNELKGPNIDNPPDA